MKKILLIEDDISLRENTAELLELAGYEVTTAPNGLVGVAQALENTPDIVVCDIMMPEKDGYGVLQELSINDETKCIPFIFLSAKTERNEIRKGMNLGADDYLTKPFEEHELLSAIESRLARTELLSEMTQRAKRGERTAENGMRKLDQLRTFFNKKGTVKRYKKGEEIYRSGVYSNAVYLIVQGIVKCFKIDKDGKELTTGLYRQKDFLGLVSLTDAIVHRETAKVVQDASIIKIPKEKLKEELRKNGPISVALIELLTGDITEIKDQLLQMAYSSVRKKTARTLLQFSKILNKRLDEPIRISRNDLASVAGIATESLIRTLSIFKNEGLIDIDGRNIRILKLDSLKDIV